MVCVRDGSATAFRVSVSQTERVRCGFPTFPRVLVTPAIRVSLWKVRQVDMLLVDDVVACCVAE